MRCECVCATALFSRYCVEVREAEYSAGTYTVLQFAELI